MQEVVHRNRIRLQKQKPAELTTRDGVKGTNQRVVLVKAFDPEIAVPEQAWWEPDDFVQKTVRCFYSPQ